MMDEEDDRVNVRPNRKEQMRKDLLTMTLEIGCDHL